MKIIKRSGTEVVFDIDKIVNAIRAANLEVEESSRLTDRQVVYAAQNVAEACENAGHTVSVEEIQDLVEDEIMRLDCYEVARHYIIYRYVQSLKRQKNTTDDKILSLIECNNEEVKQENSNKNPTVNSVQRDYMAGEISKDLTQRVLLPQEIVDAHNEGLIHFHDIGLLRSAHAQLRPGEPGGHAPERHRHLGHADREAAQLLHRLQHRHADHRSGCFLTSTAASAISASTHLAPFVEVSRQEDSRRGRPRARGARRFRICPKRSARLLSDRLRDEIQSRRSDDSVSGRDP